MNNLPQQKFYKDNANYIGALLFIAFSLLNVFELILTILWFKVPDKLILFLVPIFLPILLAFGIYKKSNWVIGLSFLYSGWILYNIVLLLKQMSSFYLSGTFSSNIAFLFLITKTLILISVFICLLTVRMQSSKLITENFEKEQQSQSL